MMRDSGKWIQPSCLVLPRFWSHPKSPIAKMSCACSNWNGRTDWIKSLCLDKATHEVFEWKEILTTTISSRPIKQLVHSTPGNKTKGDFGSAFSAVAARKSWKLNQRPKGRRQLWFTAKGLQPGETSFHRLWKQKLQVIYLPATLKWRTGSN